MMSTEEGLLMRPSMWVLRDVLMKVPFVENACKILQTSSEMASIFLDVHKPQEYEKGKMYEKGHVSSPREGIRS